MITLFTSYYENYRKDDLLFSIQKNIENKYLDKIVIICENELNIENEKLVKISSTKKQQTFTDFFNLVNSFDNPDISIISNSDMYMGDNINLVNNMKENECYALTRYEENGHLYPSPHHSQDTWIFKGKIKEIWGDFALGIIRGCDNRIAYEIEKAGYIITNPCLTIKTFHKHTVRKPPSKEAIPQPYKTIIGTAL
jgi:hypothetical protein